MRNNVCSILISIVAIIIMHPCYGYAGSKKNSHDLLSKCLGNIRPAEKSAVRSIFDKVTRNVNPTLSEKNIILLKKWFNNKQSYIQLIDNAIKINHIEFPLIDVSKDVSLMELPKFTDYRSLIGLKLIEAKIQIHEGHYNNAVQNILDVIKIGTMVRHGERSTILSYMIGTALEETGIRWLQNLLCTIKYDNRTLEQILLIINESKVRDDAFIGAIKGEFNNFIIPYTMIYSNKIEAILTQLNINPASIYDKNDSINICKIQSQKYIENAKVPWPQRSKEEMSDNNQITTSESEDFMDLVDSEMLDQFDINNSEHVAKWRKVELAAKGKHNFLGRWHQFSTSSFGSYYQRSVRLRTKRNITRTLVALAIFYNDNNYYPNRINQLRETKIINEIPHDLFSNRPLNYSVSQQKIWSTGSDEIDNNGDQENDIVFSCELMEQSQNIESCN